ncbi:hypothetical protein NYO67_9854 [Aspergillus flavus]|nr:hypothetical protein NYO67_9854 [Aspergillus flavus]
MKFRLVVNQKTLWYTSSDDKANSESFLATPGKILDSAQTPHGTLHRIRGTPSPNVVYGNPDIEFGTLDFPSACLICNVPWEEGAVRRDKSGFNLKARWKAVVALESSMHGAWPESDARRRY